MAYYKYETFNGKKLETKRLSKVIYSPKITTGKPRVSYEFKKNKKKEVIKIKVSWNKLHYEYGEKHKVGYRLYRNGKTLKTFKDNKTHSYYDANIKANKEYKYKIKAFYIDKKGKKDKKVWSPKAVIKVKTDSVKIEKKKKTVKKTTKKSTKKITKKTTKKKTSKKTKKKK